MTLGIGDHVSKLKRTWKDGVGTVDDPPALQENEMYVEFEVLALGQQGDTPFYALLKKVR